MILITKSIFLCRSTLSTKLKKMGQIWAIMQLLIINGVSFHITAVADYAWNSQFSPRVLVF